MVHAYDEMYVEGAMIRIGDMLEYACLDCGYDPDVFFKMFLQSDVSRKFERGDASVVAGRSGPELAYMVLDDIEPVIEYQKPTWRENRSEYYWSGWLLAYFQWLDNKTFHEIWDSISIRTLQRMYPTLHEADIQKSVDILRSMIKPKHKSKVQDLRILKRMTQQELANEANMSVSQLQRIEYGERKVENLTVKTALALAHALGVDVDEME